MRLFFNESAFVQLGINILRRKRIRDDRSRTNEFSFSPLRARPLEGSSRKDASPSLSLSLSLKPPLVWFCALVFFKGDTDERQRREIKRREV